MGEYFVVDRLDAACEDFVVAGNESVRLRARQVVVTGLAEQLLARHRRERSERGVERDVAVLLVLHEHRIGHGIEQRRKQSVSGSRRHVEKR